MPFADDDELVPGSEGWPPLGAKGDLELLPEEEVFEKQVMPAAQNLRYDGEQKPEKFEHQVRITDRSIGGGPTLSFAPARDPTGSLRKKVAVFVMHWERSFVQVKAGSVGRSMRGSE
jgi:hypothetical protein